MKISKYPSFALLATFLFASLACSSGEAQKNTNIAPSAATSPSANTPSGATEPKPVATSAKNFTAADIAKLKWIVGTWRGMDGDKPFYERYKLEGTNLIVEGLKEDGSLDGDPSRFELKNGEFGQGEGDKRSAASEITDTYVQFVPVAPASGKPGPGRRNSFRFARESETMWTATLEWPATADKPEQQKVYKMEPWTPTK